MPLTAPGTLNGQAIIDRFEAIIDDSVDSDQELFLLNAAKNAIESGRDWNFNRGVDENVTVGASDTYLTTHALPTDFLAPRRLYLAGDINPWLLIPFELRNRFKDIYKRWYIDWLNSAYALCGPNSGGKVVSLFYTRSTPDITLATSPVWPGQFHAILPFKMAEMWQSGSDGDEVNQRMSPANLRIYKELLDGMIKWDGRIKVSEYNALNERNIDLSSYPDIVGEEFIPGS